MSRFDAHMAENRRLMILRLLEAAAAYETNESIIALTLHDFGHVLARDQVRIDLAWLREAGLVTIEEMATIWIARLTQRGLETAQGVIVTPGVQRPSPKS
jgi:DNA-binding transcriptional ArsR family regulator